MILFEDSLPRLNGNIRFLHSIPGAPNVDIYANGQLLYSNLAFGSLTDYIDLSPQEYDIMLYKSGMHNNPLFSEQIEVLPDGMSTISITPENNEITLFVMDDVQPESDSALSYIRFINLSPNSQPLSLNLPEEISLFNKASYLEASEYYPISPGIHSFNVSSQDDTLGRKSINNINLTPGLFVTIYIIGLMNGTPQLGYVLAKDGMDKIEPR